MNLTDFAVHAYRLSSSITRARDAGDETGSLVLFYAYTDALASLLRPKDKKKTSSQYFKQFARDYLLKNKDNNLNDIDLWSARCGMLHTFSPYSDLTEGTNPKARKVVYLKSGSVAELEQFAGERFKNIIFVDPFDLINAFIDAVVQFVKDIEKNRSLADCVLFHADNFFQDFQFRIVQPIV